MDQVTIRANIAAAGVPKGATATVYESALVRGAISSGVFTEIDRLPARAPEPVDKPDVDESAPDKVEDVALTDDAADAINEGADGNQLEADLIAPSDEEGTGPATLPTTVKPSRQRKK